MNELSSGSFHPDEISDWFWEIIAQAEHNAETLADLLRAMSREEMIHFHDQFQEAAVQLEDEFFLESRGDGPSEDTMQDIAAWVVSQGKPFYSEVWNDPPRIANVDPSQGVTYFSVADNVFWERFGSAVPYREA